MSVISSKNGTIRQTHLYFIALLIVFIILRLINLRDTYLWLDDVATLPLKTPVPWGELPAQLQTSMQGITGPFIPSFIDAVLVNLFGLHTLALRLPSVIVAVVCLILLNRVITLLFGQRPWAVWVPQILFTLSVPSIIYAQQIQPSIYYFLSTIAQLYAFLLLYGENLGQPRAVYYRSGLFVLVATTLFFTNYMGLLVTALLGFVWSLHLYSSIRSGRLSLWRGLSYFLVYTLLHLPLVIFVFLLPTQGETTRNYLRGVHKP